MSTTTVKLERVSNTYHFKTKNESGLLVETDASETIGGTNLGMRPMEMLLASLVSCSTIDVVMILEKQRQELVDIKVDVRGTRVKKETYSEYSDIHMHFYLTGNIKEKKAQQAVELSIEKYCSVAMMLKKTAEITASFEIISLNEN